MSSPLCAFRGCHAPAQFAVAEGMVAGRYCASHLGAVVQTLTYDPDVYVPVFLASAYDSQVMEVDE